IGMPMATALQRLPGAEVIEQKSPKESGGEDEPEEFVPRDSSDPERRIREYKKWRLRLQDTNGMPWGAEVGVVSNRFRVIYSGDVTRRVTLKINDVNPSHHADAVRVLESAANAILFEIDLQYGILAMLSRRTQLWSRR